MDKEVLTKMILSAKQVQKNAYAPYSSFFVGAAILTDNNQIYSGCNVESANYKVICAEGSAISAMISSGDKKIKSVVIVSPNSDFIFPCGDCRQRISEFSNKDTSVIVVDNSGENYKEILFDDIFPYSFGAKDL